MKIAVNLNEVHEARPVPNGLYDLVIASAEEAKTKAGAPQLKVSIGIIGHDDAPNVTHFVSIPSEHDDPQKSQFKALMLKRFLATFGIPHGDDEFDVDDFPGAAAHCELALGEPDASNNVYNRLVLPKLVDGYDSHRGKPPSRKR